MLCLAGIPHRTLKYSQIIGKGVELKIPFPFNWVLFTLHGHKKWNIASLFSTIVKVEANTTFGYFNLGLVIFSE